MDGAKQATETANRLARAGGRGASAGGRSRGGNRGGRQWSANAGMSSEKGRENRPRRKPQGSGGRIVRSGLVGPKARPLRRSRWRHGGDSVTSRSWRRRRDIAARGERPVGRGRPARGTEMSREVRWGRDQEKRRGSGRGTVPETDTGRRGEEPQARERTLVKELGKIPP